MPHYSKGAAIRKCYAKLGTERKQITWGQARSVQSVCPQVVRSPVVVVQQCCSWAMRYTILPRAHVALCRDTMAVISCFTCSLCRVKVIALICASMLLLYVLAIQPYAPARTCGSVCKHYIFVCLVFNSAFLCMVFLTGAVLLYVIMHAQNMHELDCAYDDAVST